MSRLGELCKLEDGWDGYCAPAVSFFNATFALNMLGSACPMDAPAPQIVPGPDGDLQIEWHTAAMDIELHVIGPYDVHAWRLSATAAEDGEEFHLTNDFTIVAGWLAEMSEAAIAARSSAA
ncbi:hypothetical protein [uncultured Rhodoblastus sp.]|uniref:hypothetical protein n=1 Tax=uncultured Rhodoblastus sp. TaxID=543037 RepID=UPI0025F29040|nr:hypothetical protein [uncultured Rhodoblastus sp.]